jgi:2-polyprenyl-6-methoxyphenol hydroxylase-like FAD-dependent oxidoreductase
VPHIIVVGGGMAGLATALMLAKQGHDVTVLERDPEPLPDTPAQSWESWERTGVMQFRQPHLLHVAGWRILEDQLPEAARAVRLAGGVPWNRVSYMPPALSDRAPRPGDEKWEAVNARRPVLEHALATVAEGAVDVRRGVHVTGLVSDQPGHVCEMTSMLALPEQIFARPGMAERIKESAAGRQLPPPPGPSRTELLALLS